MNSIPTALTPASTALTVRVEQNLNKNLDKVGIIALSITLIVQAPLAFLGLMLLGSGTEFAAGKFKEKIPPVVLKVAKEVKSFWDGENTKIALLFCALALSTSGPLLFTYLITFLGGTLARGEIMGGVDKKRDI